MYVNDQRTRRVARVVAHLPLEGAARGKPGCIVQGCTCPVVLLFLALASAVAYQMLSGIS